MMWVLAAISLLLVAGYTVAVCKRLGGVPESVSASFYMIGHREAFTACMCGAALTLLPPMMERTQDEWRFLAFLTCAGLLMVGGAPRFRETVERRVHVAGATLLLAGSQAWVAVGCPLLLSVWLPWAAWTAWNRIGRGSWAAANPLFWAEVAAAASGYVTLIVM